MGLSQQSCANLTAGLYLIAGLLLLTDFLARPTGAPDPADLLAHIWPVTLTADAVVSITGFDLPGKLGCCGDRAGLVTYFLAFLVLSTWFLRTALRLILFMLQYSATKAQNASLIFEPAAKKHAG